MIAWLGGIILVVIVRLLLDFPVPATVVDAVHVMANCLVGALGAAIGLKGLARLGRRGLENRQPEKE